jgi:hypothetical protein
MNVVFGSSRRKRSHNVVFGSIEEKCKLTFLITLGYETSDKWTRLSTCMLVGMSKCYFYKILVHLHLHVVAQMNLISDDYISLLNIQLHGIKFI